ncbi:AAA family ATPase [Methanosphaera sp. ISO3-F5]|uniref:AAA family ATPase n=1 Tax=Methanosphaera sp. ISO3-F5 TaxID=1452353 RepID=UPI002B25925A|nr:AAA family ATPase [Methanosphaera sp. ISO3-F5]WQH65093.1 AAA family ATPase [Methanosphaera sp. ISO3-F5]
MVNIGILEVDGVLTLYEHFGHLPTNVVKSDGTIENGKKAHEELDGLIIPGGTIVESETLTPELTEEINLINDNDGFILGMCAGFQILSKEVNVGRNSPVPIIREGLGLLDVTFEPLINTNKVNAEIVDDTTLFTKNLKNTTVTGFHCHTYGQIESNDKNVIYSDIQRANYRHQPKRVLSGVTNKKGNILGTTVHGLLDDNPAIVNNILEYIDAANQYDDIKARNKKLHEKVFNEIAINTGNNYVPKKAHPEVPPMIMLMGTGSESGKTFLSSGIVGALRQRGIHTYVIKVGPDIRDLSPSLYVNKEKLEEWASIKIGDIGWMPLDQIIEHVKGKGYDLVLIEGVMSAATGLLNEKVPYSTAEIAYAGNIPVIMVSSVSKGGIETAAIDIEAHINLLKKMDVNTKGIILNRTYDDKIVSHVSDFLSNKSGISKNNIWSISKAKVENKGRVPEDYLQLENFTKAAIDVVNKDLDVMKFVELAEIPKFRNYLTFEEIVDIYKK